MVEKSILDQIIKRNSNKELERKRAILNENKKIAIRFNLNKNKDIDEEIGKKPIESLDNEEEFIDNIIDIRRRSLLPLNKDNK